MSTAGRQPLVIRRSRTRRNLTQPLGKPGARQDSPPLIRSCSFGASRLASVVSGPPVSPRPTDPNPTLSAAMRSTTREIRLDRQWGNAARMRMGRQAHGPWIRASADDSLKSVATKNVTKRNHAVLPFTGYPATECPETIASKTASSRGRHLIPGRLIPRRSCLACIGEYPATVAGFSWCR